MTIALTGALALFKAIKNFLILAIGASLRRLTKLYKTWIHKLQQKIR